MKSILIVLVLAAALVFAIKWISDNGGWKSEEGCHGDCKACHDRCEEQAKLNKIRKKKALDEAAAAAEAAAAEAIQQGERIAPPRPEDLMTEAQLKG